MDIVNKNETKTPDEYSFIRYRHAYLWINLSLRFATEFATDAHVWRSVGARLRLGQLHKSLFDSYKPFVHNHLQTAYSYSMDEFKNKELTTISSCQPFECSVGSDR